MSDFTLDKDLYVPTGIEATAEDVAAMLVDPGSPITAEHVAMLKPEQRPSVQEVDAEIAKASEDKLTAKQLTAARDALLGKVELISAPVEVAVELDAPLS